MTNPVAPVMPRLFEPMTLRGVTARNRIWLAPMCQYSVLAQDGKPTDWHLVHLGARATGGFGLVIAEASAVVPEGRISPEDTGIWSDEHIAAWKPIAEFVRAEGAVVGIQLAHAGRKASTHGIFTDGTGALAREDGGWEVIGPSAEAFTGLLQPREMSTDDIAHVITAFADAAVRADKAGFDLVEVHAAHGYLLHEFLSPLSNKRTDDYGGSFENRTRFLVEVVDAVRAVWPQDKPLFVRFSASEWVDGGWTVEETAELSKVLGGHGVDLVDISSGGNVADAPIMVGPGYQVPFAHQIREDSGMATAAVGLITDPHQAEAILAEGSADAVFLARAALREPSWPQRAAHELGMNPRQAPYPKQYIRGSWR